MEVDQVLVEPHPEVAEDDTDKKDPGNAQRDTGYLDFAQHDPQCNNQREDQHRMGDAAAPERFIAEKQTIQPLHRLRIKSTYFKSAQTYGNSPKLQRHITVLLGRIAPDFVMGHLECLNSI